MCWVLMANTEHFRRLLLGFAGFRLGARPFLGGFLVVFIRADKAFGLFCWFWYRARSQPVKPAVKTREEPRENP